MNIKPIKTESENEAALKRLGELMRLDPSEGTPKYAELVLLSSYIKKFEDAHYKFDKPSPQEVIKFKMEQQGLRPKDMARYFGTVSRYYEVMSGHRSLSLAMIRKLRDGLHIPADILIGA